MNRQANKEEENTGKRNPVWKVLRLLSKLVLLLFGLLLLLLVTLNIPFVQDWLTQKVERQLSQKLGTRLEIGAIRFNLFADLVIDQFYLADPNNQLVWSSDRLEVDIALLPLFDQTLLVNNLSLSQVEAQLLSIDEDSLNISIPRCW